MTLYLKGYRKYIRSKLKLPFLFVCNRGHFVQVSTGSGSRLRKGAGSNFEGARSIPYAGSATVMESATGILQGFSLRICMNLSGVNLKLHTSHSNLQSMCRPEH